MTKYNGRTPNCKCFVCGSEFYLRPKDRKRSKTGRFSCSRECGSKAATLAQVERIEERLGVVDFAEWLNQKYHIEKLNVREISKIVYGYNNGGGISRWMARLGIKSRCRSEAVAMQWENNSERRKKQAEFAAKHMGRGTKARENLISQMQTDEYKNKISAANGGSNNGMWNPLLTEEERSHVRKYPAYRKWRQSVLSRDNYTCVRCKVSGDVILEAHHINGYHWDKQSRTEVDNGATLCRECHRNFHKIYGNRNNNLFQFAQYMQSN